ncbi:MAG: hypothetical protein GXP60_07345 [Epsilonproteobacteria bacterium]|nr:hypothetical protein [Campylobacterota bacterium]
MSFATPIGIVAALLTTFGFVPQIIKLLRTRKTDGVSAIMVVQIAAGLLLWVIYGILRDDFIIIIANTIGFLLAITTLMLYLIFKNRSAD